MRLFFLLAACLAPVYALAGDLSAIDPWVAEAPPGARVVGGFLTLKNTGDQDRTVTAVSSSAAGEVQMHRTVFADGMARMVAQQTLTVPAHGQLVLEPGGYHLMLIRPSRPLAVGDHVDLHLTLSDGATLEAQAEVRPRPMGSGHEHHHH